MKMMSQPTSAQQAAIDARGNVLVMAGAGAGKTRTLVERCLAWLVADPGVHSLDQVLMVTFTEAAAAETRKRLREELDKRAVTEPTLADQAALLESAHISTLHSFCSRLIRQHFEVLGLDPQFRVLAEDQACVLAARAMDAVLERHYRGETDASQAALNLIESHGRGWDLPVRRLIKRTHEYAQTLPDPEGWFASRFEQAEAPEPSLWRLWLIAELGAWRRGWEARLGRLATVNSKASDLLALLERLPAEPSREQYAQTLADVIESDTVWPSKQKSVLRKPLETLFSEARYLITVTAVKDTDPLTEDWAWGRPAIRAILSLAREFGQAYAEEKRAAGGLDFHDLEQFAQRLLWDNASHSPTETACRWRRKFRLIFVDEYQDINAAQDAIIRALGGDGPDANRFLVGDVKQSIYRFRLANPKIFASYQRRWKTEASSQVISLSENFRSHEGILNVVNSVFDMLMTEDLGGIAYDEEARLKFGAAQSRPTMAARPGETPRVELHVIVNGAKDDLEETEEAPSSGVEIEARLVGARLLELKHAPLDGASGPSPAWKDMVVLLRSPRGKAAAYAREFSRLGIPLEAPMGGFFESQETLDLLSLLRILDNPLQDYPLLAVLRSPLAGFTDDDLASVRAAFRDRRYWTALVRWRNREDQQPSASNAPLYAKAARFLDRYHKWRRAARTFPLSRCLEMALDETRYADWSQAQERGEQRRGNVERLLQLTRQFDPLQREGLYRFLGFVKGQQDNEIDAEPAATPATDAVRLMSIHKSKGLEFPIVVAPDLSKPFNMDDLKGRVILDETLGVCPQIQPPQSRQFYPSLPYWMAQRSQKRETLGEELRLLYVAMTRAVERLVLVGTLRSSARPSAWERVSVQGNAASANCYLDWIGGWLTRLSGRDASDAPLVAGHNDFLTWTVTEAASLQTSSTATPVAAETEASAPKVPDWDAIAQQIEWSYPWTEATRRHAKTTVTQLRRQMADDENDEAEPLYDAKPVRLLAARKTKGLSGAEKGSAHHAFLELCAFNAFGNQDAMKAEARRLIASRQLTEEQSACLDHNAIASFWNSAVGRQFLSHRDRLRRELPFTARFEAEELGAGFAGLKGEYVVVQGVIDLAAIFDNEIWLLDFKTDRAEDIEKKTRAYRPQLFLYSRAISRICRKPVTQAWLHFLSAGRSLKLE
jgi:ATP-dependent helicase/nuclease subunit A